MTVAPRIRRAHRLTDRWFRAWGVAALVALAVTGAMLALDAAEWRVPFVLAHLAALSALAPLAPLALVLVTGAFIEAYREQQAPMAAVRTVLARYPVTAALVTLTLLSIAVSLANFEDGVRWLRSAANLLTVALVLVLVVRYLRSHRSEEARA